MQRLMILLVFMLLLGGLLYGQTGEILISCQPSQIFVNSLNTGSFDPVSPQNQPILSTIEIRNLTSQAYYFNIAITIKWNETIIVNNVTMKSIAMLRPGYPRTITNRDLITTAEGIYFNDPSVDISITDIMDANATLRNALQSGFFPDGSIRFELKVTPIPETGSNNIIQGIPNESSFTIRVKNINAIFPTYPGKPCGQTPPEISMRPVTFLWNTVNTNANRYRLVVKEFEPNNLPNPSTVETVGNIVFDGILEQSMFAEFLPFQDKHYYAWQVSTDLYNESNYKPEFKEGSSNNPVLKSEWYSFKYVSDQGSSGNASQQMMAILNSLSDPAIQNLLAQGYELTGVVIFEGQVYTGQEAIDLINSLMGKNLEIEIKEQ